MSTIQAVQSCEVTLAGYRCTRALGHEGRCEHPVDATVYGGGPRLDERSPEWLASEVRMLHGQIATLRRELATPSTHEARLGRLMAGLHQLVPGNYKRKTVLAADVRALYEQARS